MRVVGKFNEKDIRLVTLYMSETYGGFYVGPSEKHMEEINKRILVRFEEDQCKRLFGDIIPTLLIGKNSFDLKKRLPEVFCFAVLESSPMPQHTDEGEFGSFLVLIWLLDEAEDPFKKLEEIVKTVDWNANARNYDP